MKKNEQRKENEELLDAENNNHGSYSDFLAKVYDNLSKSNERFDD